MSHNYHAFAQDHKYSPYFILRHLDAFQVKKTLKDTPTLISLPIQKPSSSHLMK